MGKVGIDFKKCAAMIFFAIVAIAGTLTISKRVEYGIETKQEGNEVVITEVKSGSNAEAAGIKPGDVLLSFGEKTVINHFQARWLLEGVNLESPVILKLKREGNLFEVPAAAESPFHPLFILINFLLGTTFITVGLMVWWRGSRNNTVKSFFRLTSYAGIAILLFSHENAFLPKFLHYTYSILWISTYCLIPPALFEFLLRFQKSIKDDRLHSLLRWLIFFPIILIMIALAYSYIRAYQSFNLYWIGIYEAIFRKGFSTALIIYFLASLFLLFKRYLKPAYSAKKHQIRWLLICTLAGASPFFFLYKLPLILGYKNLIPIWAANSLMLMVPIGWGMAVASFKMLRLEWALSRSIIYVITTTSILILFIMFFLMGIQYIKDGNTGLLIIMILIGLCILFFSGRGLIQQVQTIVDRIYYRDWFNYHTTLMNLGAELSKSVDENSIIQILTNRLPSILKIEKVVLFIKDNDGSWRIPVQTFNCSEKEVHHMMGVIKEQHPQTTIQIDDYLPKLSLLRLKALGYQVILPLIHSEETIGILFIGEKVTEAPFSVKDYQLLNTITGQAGTALANLNLTKKLMDQEKRALAVDMAGGIAHEINNALAPLMGHAQLMELSLDAQYDNRILKSKKNL